MDNVKNDTYFANKIRDDLIFIVNYTKNIDEEELSKNEILLDSMMFRLIQISENAKRLSDEYIAFIALENDRVVGFIGLLRKLSGPYMILDMMQVSSECRGQGIGRQLFEAGKAEARKAGAEALYISACSSEETIAFYRAMGSDLASNPIKEIAEEEPFDLQMICPMKD